jgi:hypothetical protein
VYFKESSKWPYCFAHSFTMKMEAISSSKSSGLHRTLWNCNPEVTTVRTTNPTEFNLAEHSFQIPRTRRFNMSLCWWQIMYKSKFNNFIPLLL